MKKIINSRVFRLLVALCFVFSLSVSMFAVQAFAEKAVIVDGNDETDTEPETSTPPQGSVTVPGGTTTIIGNAGSLTITKHPTGETVAAGDTAVFIARADNYAKFEWRIISADGKNTVLAKNAEGYFSGLDVSGTNTERLVLANIPSSMNGWYVECKFYDDEGDYQCTKGAKLTVTGTSDTNNAGENGETASDPNANPVVPNITGQPKGANLNAGQTTILSVAANVDDGGTIKYQWYSNSVNSTAGGEAVNGATNASYQPPQKEGARYYYAAIWNSKNNKSSTVIYSTPVEVNYIMQGNTNVIASNTPAAPTTAPPITDATTPVNTQPAVTTPSVSGITGGEQQSSDRQQAEQLVINNQDEGGSNIATTLLIILGVLAVVLIAAIVFIFLKNGRKAV